MAKKMKQKQKQKQMQVVNVIVNAAEKKPVRRRAPRAKKPVAGDSIMLQRGDIPKPYSGYAPHGEPMRLAGPGQNYASLPAPLRSASYASIPSVMNPQASPAFVSSADMMYGRNRNRNDDIREIVNPSDITPVAKPSKRMNASTQSLMGAGYMPSASPGEEARSVEAASFQGEVPRLNIPNESPSMRAASSAPSAGAVLQGKMSYPGFPLQEELDDMAAEMEADAGEFASAAVGAFEPADRRIKRPVRVDVGGEASGGSRPPYSPPMTVGVDLMANPYTEQSDDVLLKMASNLGIKNARKQFAGVGFRARLRAAISEVQQSMTGGKQAAMRHGGSVF